MAVDGGTLESPVAFRFVLLALAFVGGCAPGSAGIFDAADSDESDAPSGEVEAAALSCTPKTQPVRALGGTVLTPNGPLEGYVVVQNEKILAVVGDRTALPAGATVIETNGIISPGLIDLHNHVAYNFIPLWQAGRRWQNRYQWARAAAYDRAVKDPYNAVKGSNHQCEGVKYGEYRALVGGTTTIQGSVDLSCTRAWVRNVEFSNFCEDHVRQNVLAISTITPDTAKQLNAQFLSGQTRAFFVHLAEGIDDSSRAEFEQLRALDLLKPEVVGIHSTALTTAQLTEMGHIGMKLVWSPLSNLILYGQTTNIPAALAAGVKVSVAPDWSPSGSANVLGELKVADRVNRERFGGVITDRQLWEMATANPADIAGMGDKLGRIAPGYYADLVIIDGDRAHPYRALIDAAPAQVLGTVIGGEALYGTLELLDSMGKAGSYGLIDACGLPRGLAAKSPNVPRGDETLESVTGTFAGDGVSNVIPLFQCSAAPEWAFQ
jgi:cytosine/adenosine deaminase-related metal-dependent hydrolase